MKKLLLLATITLASFASTAAESGEVRGSINQAYQYAIPNAPGKNLTAMIVDFAPGEVTPAHRHGQAFVVGYVLSGAIRSQLDNGKTVIYKAGESWPEKPGTHHTFSANASKTEPAKLLAVFVADDSEKDLVQFDK